MGEQPLVSRQDLWIDISGTWSNVTSRMAKIIDACNAITQINSILLCAPSDVGGSISFAHTAIEAENLYYKFQLLFRFVDGIHYEVDDFVDVPFTQMMKPLLEEVYKIDPKEFRTKKNFLFFQRGNSLEDLMLDMTPSKELKESYKKMVEELDVDIISDDFINVFATANYWAGQYDLLIETREIHSKYVDEYSEKWDDFSADERLAVMNEFAIEYGKVIDERSGFVRFISHELVDKVDWNINDPNYDSTSTAYAYTYSVSRNGKIYINSDAGTPSSLYDLDFVLQTVAHETRHQYQGQAKHKPSAFEIPTSITDNWLHDYTISYYVRPWEIDARAFSAISISYKEGRNDE